VFKLPSHTSDRLQPLDLSAFKAMKALFDEAVVVEQRTTGFRQLSKPTFTNVLGQIWYRALSAKNIQAGFSHAGIYPIDPSKYPRSAFQPSKLQAYDVQNASHTTVAAITPGVPAALPSVQVFPTNSPVPPTHDHLNLATTIEQMRETLNRLANDLQLSSPSQTSTQLLRTSLTVDEASYS
jgi:hypothetical protein